MAAYWTKYRDWNQALIVKISIPSSDLLGARNKLGDWYLHTPWGQILLNHELEYLTKSVCAAYNEVVLQIGTLEWEPPVLDRTCYRKFFILDTNEKNQQGQMVASLQALPIHGESVDVVIMPHILEFADDQHQLLREVDRILKPEGHLYYLGFAPLGLFGLLHYWPGNKNQAPWCGHFIGQHKMLDRLSLLNFEAKVAARFRIKPNKPGFTAAYAIKAIKRRYTVIPLGPARVRPQLMPAGIMERKICKDSHGS